MLTVSDLHAFYGKSHILHGVDLQVNGGEIVSLLGRNGVGRSTTVKAIMGDVRAQGSVRFRDEEVCGLPPYVIAHDATLAAIAEAKPRSLAALRRVKGMGPTKTEKYGDEILAVLERVGE